MFWKKGLSTAMVSISHPTYLTPYLSWTWAKAVTDIGMYITTAAVVFMDSKDEIFGVSDKTRWTILSKFPLEMRLIFASLVNNLWQPVYIYQRFILAAVLKVVFALLLVSLVNEVHTKRFRPIAKYLIYSTGLTLLACEAANDVPRGLMLAGSLYGWTDTHGIDGDAYTATLFIIALSALSTYFAYWKINPIWPLCSLWMILGVVCQHTPKYYFSSESKGALSKQLEGNDPHFRDNSKSYMIFAVGLHAMLWNFCIAIGSMVMMGLLRRAGRLTVLFSPFKALARATGVASAPARASAPAVEEEEEEPPVEEEEEAPVEE